MALFVLLIHPIFSLDPMSLSEQLSFQLQQHHYLTDSFSLIDTHSKGHQTSSLQILLDP